MNRIQVGVVRGGLSGEHDVSLLTGEAVLQNLPDRYDPIDIVIDKYNAWHCGVNERKPAEILSRVDVVFNALHGFYGEDGKIQKLLGHVGVPYTGSDVIASALGMNKEHAKEIFMDTGLKTPAYTTVREKDVCHEDIAELYRTMPQPSVIKPLSGGSSLDVFIAHDLESFEYAIGAVLKNSSCALIEEYITGREGTCGVLDCFRGEEYYALPPTEIIPPPEKDFFDYDAKYTGMTQEICPANFTKEEKSKIMNMAVMAHRALGLRHYSRSDFIVSPRGVYLFETNTLPGLTPESLLPKAMEAVGLSFPDFLDHVITQALGK